METGKKTFWAGVVNNEIGFFTSDPNGNVEGLQGSRKFCVEGNSLTDDNGHNITDNTAIGGLNSETGAETLVQTDQNTGQSGQQTEGGSSQQTA
jgi:hypothetical protein